MKKQKYQIAFKIWKEMREKKFMFNDFTISVSIQLFSKLNMQKEAYELYLNS